MMGAATAADDNLANETVSTSTDDVDTLTIDNSGVDEDVSAADTKNILVANNDDNLNLMALNNDNELLKSELNNVKTYDELNKSINDSNIKEINIENDIQFSNIIFINRSNLIINGNGHTFDAQNKTGIFNIVNNTNSNITFNNILFKNTKSFPAIRGYFNNSMINNCNFTNCYNSGDGGALNVVAFNMTIENCIFKSCQAGGHAGAGIFSGLNITIKSSVFIDNYARSYEAGGLVINTENFLISDCSFINNSANRWNGALRFSGNENQSGEIKNTYFENNSGNLKTTSMPTRVAGAMGFYNEIAIRIDNCTFIDNKGQYGGSIVNTQYAAMNITNCKFINNTATKNGGALYIDGQRPSRIVNCSFNGNDASNGGAVVFNAPNSKIINCNFTNNTATNHGGAIYSNAQGSSVENATFTNNSAPVGTDFYVTQRGTLDFIGLVFSSLWVNDTNNSDAAVNKGFGTSNEKPAIWTDELYSFLNTKNGAKTTIYIVGTVNSLDEKLLKISNLEIVGYDPVNNPGGAVIDMSNWTHRAFTTMAEHITFRNIKFKNLDNITINGGVILCNADFTNIVNCTFSDINVTGNGGAIYVNKNVGNIQNSTFMNNNVTGDGASIYVNGDSFILSGSSFSNNNAKGNGTVYVNKKQSANIINSDFKNNHAYDGACIYIKGNVFYNQENNTFAGSSIVYDVVNGTNVSDFEARKMLMHVYVNLTGTNESEGIIDDPMDLHTAFNAVNSNGIITFIDKTDKAVYAYPAYREVPLAKQGVIFDGQLGITTFVNIGFVTTEHSSGSCIYNLTFTKYTNAAIVCSGSDNYAVNCIFENNTATCIKNTGKNNRAINCTFNNNKVNNGVSCLEISNDGFTNLTDCKFINNTHKTGVISINDGACSIDNCTFTNNTGSSVGVLSNVNGTVSILDSRFNYNHGSDAGVIYNTNSTLTITGSEFNNNNATLGGAVYNNGTLTITGSEFNNNNATLGGAIYNDNGTLTIKDTSSFNGNNATCGGAIYNNAVLDITDSSFTGNNASNFGGAIFSNGNLTVSDSSFVGNNATLGGALFLNSTNNKITGVLFSGNRAVNGSAVYVNRTGDITLRNDTFADNVASTKGTVYFNQDASIETTTTGDDLIFTNNIPEDDRFVFADNVNYTSNVLYVSPDGVGDGLTSANRANLTYALEHAAEDAIIYLEKDDYTFNALKFTANQVTIVGNGSTVKGNKYLFILQVFK